MFTCATQHHEYKMQCKENYERRETRKKKKKKDKHDSKNGRETMEES